MKNADGYDIEHTYIDEIQDADDWYYLTKKDGWTIGVSKEECDGLVPKVGDDLDVYTQGFSSVVGVTIAGKVVRYQTPAQVERERIDWLINYNQEKLDRLRENYDAWQAEVDALHPVLKARIRRFENDPQRGVNSKFEFWLESGGYEMYAVNGANALLNWAEQFPEHERVNRLQDWWALNTKEGGYDYKAQMEMIPEFGKGHSGNTAGAGYSLAIGILTGSYKEAGLGVDA